LGKNPQVILAPEDAAWLIKETASDQTVLIGGQAVAFWATYFGLSPRIPALTRDIDYLGTKAAAKSVSQRLKIPHKLSIATLDDATASAAVLVVPVEGYPEPIIIDYLASILGVATADIKKSAVTVEIDNAPLRVMHPLQLLQSKIWNLYILEEKRTDEGREQARLAVEIAAAYVNEAATTQRELLDAIETIAKFSATAPSIFARKNFQLECLDAIPTHAFEKNILPSDFHEKRWPQLLKANAGFLKGPNR
jgi:hypothetical protein